MSRTGSGMSVLAAALTLWAQGIPASAESALAERTWVSGGLGGTGDLARSVLGSALGIGDDKNPCTRSQPCATLTRALAQTADGGEINVVDSGGFLDSGGLAIKKSVTIDGGGAFAGVRVGGANAFLIQAGSNDRVILRNLSIDGRGTGLNGIVFATGGVLRIENCIISNFDGWGIQFRPSAGNTPAQLYVENTVLTNNGLLKGTNNSDTDGGGIHVAPQGTGNYRVVLNKVRVEHNRDGIKVDGSNGTAQISGQISFPAFINVTLDESASIGNNFHGFTAVSGTGKTPVRAMLNGFTAANNVANGIEVNGVSTYVLLGESTITLNGGHGLYAVDSGHITSYQNNKVNLNGVQPNDPAAMGPATVALQ
jgi:Right handed beta helix region